MTEPRRHTIDVEVRYAETDKMGVVHHANYLIWFELARTALCASGGRHYSEIEQQGIWLMVTGAHLTYRDGARYGDRVQVDAWIARLGSRALHFGYEVRRGEYLLVRGSTEHVWVEAESKKMRRMPAELEPMFRQLAEPQ